VRLGEERFEEQVQQKIVSADVDDVRDRRPHAGDVREVLIRSHTDVRAAFHTARDQVGDDVEVASFVRDEVVSIENPFRFGQPFDFLSETDATGQLDPWYYRQYERRRRERENGAPGPRSHGKQYGVIAREGIGNSSVYWDPMVRLGLRVLLVATLASAAGATHPASGQGSDDLLALMARLGASVERYFHRAQSIICLETVRLQSLGFDLATDGSSPRQLAYELRVAWEPRPGDQPEATVTRQLLKVNGRAPRAKDEPGCMDPRPVSPEPLSMFLPVQQRDYIFTVAGHGRVHGRPAVMIDYRSREEGPVTVDWRKECFSIDLPGRSRGRVWVDTETDEVLRLDEHLTRMFDVSLPPEHQTPSGPTSVTVERLDSSILYRPVTFREPDETVMLPHSIDTLTIVRRSGVPRLRTNQTFSNYRRFVTAGRVVQD